MPQSQSAAIPRHKEEETTGKTSFVKNVYFVVKHVLWYPIPAPSPSPPARTDRWRKAVLCRTADRPGRQSFKEAILARQIEVRIMGVVNDLHAADARYRDDFRKRFMSQRSVVFASKESSQCKDRALNSTVSEMRLDKSRVWTSVEIHKTYTTHGGTNLSRAQFIQQISDVFADDLLIFSSPGLTNIFLFRNTASKLLRLVEEEKDDKSTELVAKQTVKECKELNGNKSIYNTRIDKKKMQQRR